MTIFFIVRMKIQKMYSMKA